MTNNPQPNPYGDNASALFRAGWRGVLPLPAGTKFPPPNGYTGGNGAWPSYADVFAWTEEYAGGNIGLRLPDGVIGIDVDAYDDKRGADTLSAFEFQHGTLPDTWRITSRMDGVSGIRLYRVPEGLRWPGEVGPHVEIVQTRHRYCVAPPSIHPSGMPYMWVRPDGTMTFAVPTVDDITWLPDSIVEALTRGELVQEYTRANVANVADALAAMPVSATDNPFCPAVKSALLRALDGIEKGSRHDAALRVVMHITHLGYEGHDGAARALELIEGRWRKALGDDRTADEAGREWQRMVKGAVAIAQGSHGQPATFDPCTLAQTLAGAGNAPIVDLLPGGSPEPVTGSAVRAADGPERAQAGIDAPLTADAAAAAHRALVAQYVMTQRARREARRELDDEEATQAWREPPSLPSLRDELQLPDEPLAWLVEGVQPAGSNVVLTAQFKTGKTTLVTHYAACLVDGKPFLDTFPVSEFDGTVAIWNYEVSAAQYRRWLRDAGIVNAERIVVLHLRGFTTPLHTPYGMAWAARWLAERDVRVWILDPFARAMTGLDENSNADVGRFVECLDTIKETAGVRDLVMPTHTGRAQFDVGQERARGATRLDDWPDVRWLLTKDDEEVRYFRATGRDVDVAEHPLTFNNVNRALSMRVGDTRTRRRVGEKTATPNAENAVMQAVLAIPGASMSGISRFLTESGTGIRKARVLEAVHALASQGYVKLVEENRAVRAYPLKDARPS